MTPMEQQRANHRKERLVWGKSLWERDAEIARLRGVLSRHFQSLARCHSETRAHGLLCECFAPKSPAEKLTIEYQFYGLDSVPEPPGYPTDPNEGEQA
jgi:hypothetical protein